MWREYTFKILIFLLTNSVNIFQAKVLGIEKAFRTLKLNDDTVGLGENTENNYIIGETGTLGDLPSIMIYLRVV